MLNSEEIIKKLYLEAERFEDMIRKKKYAQASHCVQACRTVAVFIDLDERTLMNLFGGRAYGHEEIEGLFNEKDVLKAMEWCIKNDQTLQDLTLKDKKEREEVWSRDSRTISKAIKRYR